MSSDRKARPSHEEHEAADDGDGNRAARDHPRSARGAEPAQPRADQHGAGEADPPGKRSDHAGARVVDEPGAVQIDVGEQAGAPRRTSCERKDEHGAQCGRRAMPAHLRPLRQRCQRNTHEDDCGRKVQHEPAADRDASEAIGAVRQIDAVEAVPLRADPAVAGAEADGKSDQGETQRGGSELDGESGRAGRDTAGAGRSLHHDDEADARQQHETGGSRDPKIAQIR